MPRLVNLANLQQLAAINLNLDPGRVGGPIVIPSCVQVRFVWHLTNGKEASNVLYGRYGGGFTPSSTIAEQIRTSLTTGANWTTHASFLATGVSFVAVTLKDVGAPNLPEFFSTGTPAFGTAAGTALPDEVALVLTLKTARTGPGGRGRLYQPGYASNALGAGGQVNSAARDAYNQWGGGSIPNAFIPAGLEWVLGLPARAAYVSPTTGTSHPARPAQALTIASATVQNLTWDSQRGRGLA